MQKLPEAPRSSERGQSDLEKSLRELLATAGYLHEVLHGEGGYDSLPADKKEEVRRGAGAITEHLENLREAFKDKALIPLALEAADQLSFIPGVGSKVLPVLVSNTDRIVAYMCEYPKELSLPLKVLAFTKILLDGRAEEANDSDARRRSAKLSARLTEALPDFEVYFSEANPAHDEEIVERLLSLSSLMVALSARNLNAPWLTGLQPKLMAALLMGDGYDAPPKRQEHSGGALHSQMLTKFLSAPRREILKQFLLAHQRLVGTTSVLYAKICEQLNIPASVAVAGTAKDGGVYMLDNSLNQHPAEGEKLPVDIMLGQLEAIRALERERPGAAGVLHRAFGIRFFSRYPTELLVKQYDERDTDKPFGIVMTGVWDSNGAFLEKGNSTVFYRKMARQLPPNYAIRFIEASERTELERHLKFMRDAYGQGNKASFLVLRSHGHAWNLALGPSEDTGYLMHSDLTKHNYAQYRDVFTDDFVTIMDGCALGKRKAGKSGSIALEWSRVFQSVVYAPKGINTAHFDLTIENKGGKPAFTPRYVVNMTREKAEEADAHMYKNGRHYTNGESGK